MKPGIKPVLWGFIILSLLLLFPSVLERKSNEDENKAVLLAADLKEFTYNSALPLDLLLDKFKSSGINALVAEAEDFYSLSNEVLKTLKGSGFNIVIKYRGLIGQRNSRKELKNLLSEYKIKYTALDEPINISDKPGAVAASGLIKEYGMSVILFENEEQTGYLPFPGIRSFVADVDYSISRGYMSDQNSLSALSREDMVFRWLRGIVDRGIRVICLAPFKNPALSSQQNIDSTLESASELSYLLAEKGYEIGMPPAKSSPALPGRLKGSVLLLNILSCIFLYISNFTHSQRKLCRIFTCTSILSCMAAYFWEDSLLLMSGALAASIAYPSLAMLYFILCLEKASNQKAFLKTAFPFSMLFLIMAAGVLTITAAMSDIRYTMHLINFNGALLTYTIPLAAFIFSFNTNPAQKSTQNSGLDKKPLLLSLKSLVKGGNGILEFFKYITLALAAIVILYIYLSRSGNYSLLPATPLEVNLRKALEKYMSVRPRFKEFIVGYPCIFMFIFFYHGKSCRFTLPVLGLGSTIGIISITNSFCHGFTPISVSLHRTLNGIALGLITGSSSIFILWALKKVMFAPQSSSSRVRKKLGIKFSIK